MLIFGEPLEGVCTGLRYVFQIPKVFLVGERRIPATIRTQNIKNLECVSLTYEVLCTVDSRKYLSPLSLGAVHFIFYLISSASSVLVWISLITRVWTSMRSAGLLDSSHSDTCHGFWPRTILNKFIILTHSKFFIF